jgi:hypothetical protein
MKKKRYQEGGEAEGISGTAGRMSGDKKPRTTDDMTFGKAFDYYRKKGEKTFMWRGDKYTTETKEEKDRKRADKDLKEVEVTGKRRMPVEDFMKGSDRTMGVKTGAKRSQPSVVDFKSAGRRGPEYSKEDLELPRSMRRGTFDRIARGFNRGGSIDGCAKRGKTRGKIV